MTVSQRCNSTERVVPLSFPYQDIYKIASASLRKSEQYRAFLLLKASPDFSRLNRLLPGRVPVLTQTGYVCRVRLSNMSASLEAAWAKSVVAVLVRPSHRTE